MGVAQQSVRSSPPHILLRSVLALVLLAGFGTSWLLYAAQAKAPAPAESADRTERLDSSVLGNLSWRNIGPAVTGGRIVDFAVVERDPRVIYAATASGGAWKTTNAGITWQPVFEKAGTITLGGIAVAPSNPNIVWIGTGEPNARNLRSTSWGDGAYKSEDGGKTWKNMGLTLSQHIGRLVIHPEDPNIVYVSCVGSMWTNDPKRNEARGLFRTTDGGVTWTRVLSASGKTGIVDVVMDSRDPRVLYAAAWQRERRDWSFFNTGSEGGIYRTADGGSRWEKLSNGLPKGEVGRIGLSVCRSRPDTVYAVIEGDEGGLYRSDDRGASWEHMSKEAGASMYYGQVRCDPNDPERVYVLETRIHTSVDGGRTFRTDMPGQGVHVDHHALWINPANSDRMPLGNDGGIYFSYDRGQNWRFAANLSIAQFYTVAVDGQKPFYHVYGGTQDNNSLGGPSGTRNTDGIVNDDWYLTVGGDGFYVQADPVEPWVVYTESQYGRLVRFDTRTGERRLIQTKPVEGQTYRWNWSAPVLISGHDHNTVFFGAQFLFRSVNRGDSWEVASPDLTRQITIAPEHRISDYGTIRVIAESSLDRGRLGVGTDDGLVQLTRDGGATWQKIDGFPGVPELAQVSRLVLSAHDADTVYAAFSAHESDDFKPYVLKSMNFGRTWTSIVGGLPPSDPVRSFVEHPRQPRLLFAGTEHGVFVSTTGGGTWVSLQNNLPSVPIHDMVIHPRENDLVLGTHGRGFWILDDIQILEELTEDVLASETHLARLRPAVQMHRFDRGRDSQGQSFFAAPNPPDGAIITYYVSPRIATPPQDKTDKESDWSPPRVTTDILGAEGQVVRRLEPAQGEKGAGVHRLVWDLRHAMRYEPSPEESTSFFQGPLKGPFVLPGRYRVRLTVGDIEREQTVEVQGDPLIQISAEERRLWHATLVALDQMAAAAKAVLTSAEQMRSDLEAARKALEDAGLASSPLTSDVRAAAEEAEKIHQEMKGAERRRGEREGPPPLAPQILELYRNIEISTGAPTEDQRRMALQSHERLTEQVTKVNRLLSETLPALCRRLDEQAVGWTPGRKISAPPLPPMAPPR